MKIFKTLSLAIQNLTIKRQDSISSEIYKFDSGSEINILDHSNEENDQISDLKDIRSIYRRSPYHPHSPAARLCRSPAGRGGSPAGRGGKHPDYLRELGYYSDSGRQTPGNVPSVFPNLNELPEIIEPAMFIARDTLKARIISQRYLLEGNKTSINSKIT